MPIQTYQPAPAKTTTPTATATFQPRPWSLPAPAWQTQPQLDPATPRPHSAPAGFSFGQISVSRPAGAGPDNAPRLGPYRFGPSIPLATRPTPELNRNRTGLPDKLKAGVEALSGMSMDDVRVHYNSAKPAQLQALAYTQGTEIHVGPGQERHLPHEAWHVVQQAQGRVKPTLQVKSLSINDDIKLEQEAEVTRSKALATSSLVQPAMLRTHIALNTAAQPIQGIFDITVLMDLLRSIGISFDTIYPFVATIGLFTVITIIKKCISTGKITTGDIYEELEGAKEQSDRKTSSNNSKGVQSPSGNTKSGNTKKRNSRPSGNSSGKDEISEGEDEITEEQMAAIYGRQTVNANNNTRTQAPAYNQNRRPVTLEDYNRKVNLAAEQVVSEITRKLEGIGDIYGSIRVCDEWSGYTNINKSKMDYYTDIINKVRGSYSQSRDNDQPYYNWVWKRNRYTNFTKKDRKGDKNAGYNIHFDY